MMNGRITVLLDVTRLTTTNVSFSCPVPTCGVDTHFASICPQVYGQDGYRHFELKPGNSARKDLNPTAREYKPQNSSVLAATSDSMHTHKHTHGNTETSCALPTVMGYMQYGSRMTFCLRVEAKYLSFRKE